MTQEARRERGLMTRRRALATLLAMGAGAVLPAAAAGEAVARRVHRRPRIRTRPLDRDALYRDHDLAG